MNKNKEESKVQDPEVLETKVSTEEIPTPQKMRRIVIETDGNNISLQEADVSGNIELIAILQNVIGHLSKPR